MLTAVTAAACRCSPTQAFDVAKQLVAAWDGSGQKSAKLAPRLRDFQPALVGYALSGQADKAAQVAELMTQHCKLDLTGARLASLRGCCVHARASGLPAAASWSMLALLPAGAGCSRGSDAQAA